MKTNRIAHADTGTPTGARIYYIDRRCVGTRSAQEVFTALVQVHRP